MPSRGTPQASTSQTRKIARKPERDAARKKVMDQAVEYRGLSPANID